MRSRRRWALCVAVALLLAPSSSQAVDITITATATGKQGEPVAGQEVQIVPPETSPGDLALPGPGVPKDQTGHDRDPIQGVTGTDGRLILTGPPEDFGLAAGSGGSAYRLAVPRAESKSQILFFDPALGVGRARAGLPASLDDFLVSAGPIGGILALTFAYPAQLGGEVANAAMGLDALRGQEPNNCRDKQPALSPDAWPVAPPGSDLPEARLELGPEGRR